ncbi:hypothetical protein L7F22_000090 [Adiantum nelumboides]|nr:hypothetical protein [Adiantum nelumboides]
MLLLGLASVTFRERSVPDVVRLAVDAGSEVVEWAGDRHVRPGDRAAASAARGACAGAGLRIGTYGSYHKAGASDPGEFDAVVATAAELGAPRVRVWAGTAASADVSPAGRAATVDALRRCADAVAERGMGLLVEHHVESLTDGLDTALRLRAEVGHPALVTHWQPRELPDTDVCLAEVRALRPATVHAFSWVPTDTPSGCRSATVPTCGPRCSPSSPRSPATTAPTPRCCWSSSPATPPPRCAATPPRCATCGPGATWPVRDERPSPARCRRRLRRSRSHRRCRPVPCLPDRRPAAGRAGRPAARRVRWDGRARAGGDRRAARRQPGRRTAGAGTLGHRPARHRRHRAGPADAHRLPDRPVRRHGRRAGAHPGRHLHPGPAEEPRPARRARRAGPDRRRQLRQRGRRVHRRAASRPGDRARRSARAAACGDRAVRPAVAGAADDLGGVGRLPAGPGVAHRAHRRGHRGRTALPHDAGRRRRAGARLRQGRPEGPADVRQRRHDRRRHHRHGQREPARDALRLPVRPARRRRRDREHLQRRGDPRAGPGRGVRILAAVLLRRPHPDRPARREPGVGPGPRGAAGERARDGPAAVGQRARHAQPGRDRHPVARGGPRPVRRALLLLAVAAGAVLLTALVLGTGTPAVAPHRLPAVLGASGGIEHVVVTELRVPRLLLGVLTGAALGLAGLLLQDGLRNPLAVPELLGVSSGAAAAVAVTVVTGAAVPFAPLLPAVVGAVTGGALTLLAVRGAVGPAAVLLIGAGVGAALQALLLAAVAMTGSSEQGVLVRYLLGSLTGTTWATVTPVLPALAVAFVAGVAVLPLLGPLRLGDDAASALGLRTGAARAAVLGVACLLVAAVVGPAGPVAWVGCRSAASPRGSRSSRAGCCWCGDARGPPARPSRFPSAPTAPPRRWTGEPPGGPGRAARGPVRAARTVRGGRRPGRAPGRHRRRARHRARGPRRGRGPAVHRPRPGAAGTAGPGRARGRCLPRRRRDGAAGGAAQPARLPGGDRGRLRRGARRGAGDRARRTGRHPARRARRGPARRDARRRGAVAARRSGRGAGHRGPAAAGRRRGAGVGGARRDDVAAAHRPPAAGRVDGPVAGRLAQRAWLGALGRALAGRTDRGGPRGAARTGARRPRRRRRPRPRRRPRRVRVALGRGAAGRARHRRGGRGGRGARVRRAARPAPGPCGARGTGRGRPAAARSRGGGGRGGHGRRGRRRRPDADGARPGRGPADRGARGSGDGGRRRGGAHRDRPPTVPYDGGRCAVTVLRAEGVTVRFDGRTVLDGVDLAVDRGQWLSLVGRNGCGKTTLLRVLAGLHRPDAGAVHLADRPLAGTPRREVAKRVAVLPQALPPLGGVTVRALVAQGRYAVRGPLGMLGGGADAAVSDALAATGTQAWADTPVELLSGGNASGCGSRSPWPRTPRCCCSTSPPPTSTSATSWRCSTWSGSCRSSAA